MSTSAFLVRLNDWSIFNADNFLFALFSRIEATDDDNFEYFRDAYSEEDRSDQGL